MLAIHEQVALMSSYYRETTICDIERQYAQEQFRMSLNLHLLVFQYYACDYSDVTTTSIVSSVKWTGLVLFIMEAR